MKAMLEPIAINQQQDVGQTNSYIRPKHLIENKQKYLANLNREKETIWGQPIEEVTINIPVFNNFIRKYDSEKEIKALKVGHLYFYVKDEATPDHPFDSKELKALLLEGDIGCVIDEKLVTEGYCYEGGDPESPSNYFEKIFASIGAAPFLENCHEWQICL